MQRDLEMVPLFLRRFRRLVRPRGPDPTAARPALWPAFLHGVDRRHVAAELQQRDKAHRDIGRRASASCDRSRQTPARRTVAKARPKARRCGARV